MTLRLRSSLHGLPVGLNTGIYGGTDVFRALLDHFLSTIDRRFQRFKHIVQR